MNSMTRTAGILGITFGLSLGVAVIVSYDGGETDVHACVHQTSRVARIVDEGTPCRPNEMAVQWSIQGPSGPPGPPGATVTPSLILREDFDKGFLPSAQWAVSATNNGAIIFPPSTTPGTIRLDTSSTSGGDSITLRGNRQFSVNDGTLIFTAQAGAYHDCCIYGDGQPRGLAAGANRNDAIEFVSASQTAVYARTVSGGAATQTFYDLGETLYLNGPNHAYQIVASATEVTFYVNGIVVATHTTNIPSAPLNVLFTSSDGGAGTTPIDLDYVSFAIAR
jgi:hypothetical protein